MCEGMDESSFYRHHKQCQINPQSTEPENHANATHVSNSDIVEMLNGQNELWFKNY